MSLIRYEGQVVKPPKTLSLWSGGWSEGTDSVPLDASREHFFNPQAPLGFSGSSQSHILIFSALMPTLSCPHKMRALTFPRNHSPILLPIGEITVVVAALLCIFHSDTAPETLVSSAPDSYSLGSVLTPAHSPQRPPSPSSILCCIIAQSDWVDGSRGSHLPLDQVLTEELSLCSIYRRGINRCAVNLFFLKRDFTTGENF